ncbi:MAG: hypothetical protein ACMUIL_00215 [bacterium]
MSEEMQNPSARSSSTDDGEEEIITATLAELYFSQGFLERSIEIYTKLLTQHPDRQEWNLRLKQIQTMVDTVQPGAMQPSPAQESHSGMGGDNNKRQKILATLEQWLRNCQNMKKSKLDVHKRPDS